MFLKNFGRGRKWLCGKITKITGPVSYHMRLDDGRQRCHQDQLLSEPPGLHPGTLPLPQSWQPVKEELNKKIIKKK